MSDTHYDPLDSESASFLADETKEVATSRGFPIDRVINRKHRFITLSYLLVCILLAFGIFIGVAILVASTWTSETTLLPSQAIFAKIPKVRVIFNPDNSYNDDPFGPDKLESAWSKLPPPGKGHVKIQDPGLWGLSGGFPLEDENQPGAEEYTISVFHQLHCLAAIKSKMSRLQDWYAGENDKEYLTFALGESHVTDEHIYHCFDYIRQAIMCNGDTTLERPRVVDGNVVRGVDGWGVTHECRDYGAIYSFAEEHRSSNLSGID